MFDLKGENMPNFFQLCRKTDGQPENLSKIDEDLCGLLGETPDPDYYVRPLADAPAFTNWYDSIGGRLACGWPLEGEKDGKTLDLIKMPVEGETEEQLAVYRKFEANYNKILAHLRENYTSDAWASR